ncbi:hypothetical protein ACHQM5_017974 [Ranunculus cassubicifolius]
MGSHNLLVTLFLLAIASSVLAYDPSPLQDFCVGDPNSPVSVNGLVCKNPAHVNNKDFIFKGKFNRPGNTSNRLGSIVTPSFVPQFPALNTMGVAMARLDFALGGVNPLHAHPRAAEILVCVQGTLSVGFVTSNPENRFFGNILHPGDLAVFPQGLIHFQVNIGREPVVAFVGISSQNPGVITFANDVFNSTPPLPDILLQKSFGVGQKVINELRATFGAV